MKDKLLIDAIAYALSREVVPSTDYYDKMQGIQRRQAVSIAGMAQTEQIKFVMAQVNSALASGQTFEQFQKSVNLVDIDLPRHRLRTIYQTNIQQAYAHGRWAEQQRNKQDKPYLIYLSKNDSKVRPSHQLLHRTIRPIDDAFWTHSTPPLSFNCRCVSRAITKEEAEQRGITTDSDLPASQSEQGFGNTPAQYNERFTTLVNDRVSELMLTYFKQSSTIAKIGGRITGAIDKFLNKTTTKLSVLIAAAKKLLEDDEE